jgi:hypothetical protein
MEVVERIETAIAMVEEARGVPLSASCVLHRGEILELLDSARAAFPADLANAQEILRQQDNNTEINVFRHLCMLHHFLEPDT